MQNTNIEHFSMKKNRQAVQGFFSEDMGISYCSKACSNRAGLSITQNPSRFGHVQTKKYTIEKQSITITRDVPLKRRTSVQKEIFGYFHQNVECLEN